MFRRKRRIPESVLRQVVAHTKHGDSIEGVLGGAYPDCVAIHEAFYVRDDGTRLALDKGLVLIPLDSLSFIQELAGGARSQN